jgi:hypothetical protein
MKTLHPNANYTIPLISESASASQSIEVHMFKDPCLMGVFPLLPHEIPNVAPINMISSDGSYDPRRVPSPLASSLPVPQDPIPLPSSLPGDPLATSNHKMQRTKRKGGRCRKRKPTQKALASMHHVGHHPPSATANHVGGKAPTSSHYDGKKLASNHLTRT